MVHAAAFLKDIFLRQKTGHLSFLRGEIQKHFYFQEGNLIFVKTNVPGERLGEVLFAIGKITRQTLDSIPSLIQPDSMLGETLVQKKLISRQDLYEALVQQMTMTTLSVFPIFDAEIAFRERDRFFEGGLQQKMSLIQLIARGIREMGSPPALKDFLAGKIPTRANDENIALLTRDEKSVYDQADGVKDVEALAAGCKGSVDAFRKSIFLLFGLDLVELKNPPKTVLADEKRAQADDLKARLQEVEELQAEMGALDDYQILGVRSDSDENEVKKSYFKMARKFHPDLFGRSLGPAQKDLVEGVFDGITKAYRNLLAKLGKSEAAPKSAAPPPASNQGRSKGAEIHFRQAKTLYHNGRYEEAISLLEEAVRIKDDKGDYFLLLALAQSRIPALRRKAERNFLQAIELEPWNPEALIGLGMLYKKEGLVARAKKQFERAVEADPEHAGARQELRSIQSKSTSQKGLKGILTKDLFGSKKK